MTASTSPPRCARTSYRRVPTEGRAGMTSGVCSGGMATLPAPALLDALDVVDHLLGVFAGRRGVEILVDALRGLQERCGVGLGDGHALGLDLVLDVLVLVENELAVEGAGMRPRVHHRLL